MGRIHALLIGFPEAMVNILHHTDEDGNKEQHSEEVSSETREAKEK